MKKNSLKKLLAYAFAVYASAAGLQATGAGMGYDTGLSFVKFPEFYREKYACSGGTISLMQENAQREDAVGGTLSVFLGMEQIWNGDRGSHKLAEGFGYQGNRLFTIKDTNALKPESNVLDLSNIIASYNPAMDANGVLSSTNWNPVTDWGSTSVNLEAKHRRCFLDICYVQDLGQFYEGLHFYVSTAAVHVRNELKADFAQVTAPKYETAAYTTGSATLGSATGSSLTGVNTDALKGTVVSLGGNTSVSSALDGSKLSNGLTPAKFFAGTEGAIHNVNGQQKLSYGKIASGSQSEVALNNIRMGLGLKVVDSENASVCVKLEGSIPTGRELKGEYLLEPQAGERHFKLGGAAYANACFAEGSDYKACVHLGGLWHYAFKRKANRLPSCTKSAMGQYSLGFTTGQTTDAQPIINIIMDKVNGNLEVKPGSTLNANAAACMEKGSLVFDLGYNFHYTQDEKHDLAVALENVFALANNQASSAKAQTGGAFAAGTAEQAVKLEDFNFDAKAAALHNISASVGFMCKDCNYPSSINLIGGYEFAHNRSRNREVFSVTVKGCVCF